MLVSNYRIVNMNLESNDTKALTEHSGDPGINVYWSIAEKDLGRSNDGDMWSCPRLTSNT